MSFQVRTDMWRIFARRTFSLSIIVVTSNMSNHWWRVWEIFITLYTIIPSASMDTFMGFKLATADEDMITIRLGDWRLETSSISTSSSASKTPATSSSSRSSEGLIWSSSTFTTSWGGFSLLWRNWLDCGARSLWQMIQLYSSGTCLMVTTWSQHAWWSQL